LTIDPKIVARRPWVILGCGYTGTHLARRLLEARATVTVTRRSRAALDEIAARCPGVKTEVVDLADAGALDGLIPDEAVVVDSVPPSAGDVSADRAVARASAEAGASRLVYLSSTGVYPPADGAWVDEEVAPAPAGARGQARLAAEQALLEEAEERGLSAVTLRIVGIYGPGRGVVARMKAGRYRVIGTGDTWVNRVHVHDIASAIMAAGVAEPLEHRVYNVADDGPEPSAVYAAAVAEALGLPPPPRVPLSEVPPAVAAMLGANRRVSNRRMKESLGVILRYPTWRDSLAELVAE
jgi:nucleoside-diphosphate-sugar epimerase